MKLLVEVSRDSKAKAPLAMAVFFRRALHGMVMLNRVQLKTGEVPPLYKSGVRYKAEPLGVETLRDALTTYRLRFGDCAHLAAWRVAELQEVGEQASIRIETKPSKRKAGLRLYHVVVRRGNGSIEDPSKILGMGRWQ